MQSVIRKLVLAIVVAATGIPVAHSAAEVRETVRWYDLEVIIFRHSDPRTDERWPLDRGVPDITDLQPLYPPAQANDAEAGARGASTSALDSDDARRLVGAPEPYAPLPDDMLAMTNYHDALERSGRYEPLLHAAWSQPSKELGESPKVRITLPGALDAPDETPEAEDDTGNTFGDEFTFESTRKPSSDTTDDAAAAELTRQDEEPAFAQPLDGYLQLGVGRYLHVNMDLIYLPEDLDPDAIDGKLATRKEAATREDDERLERRRAIMEALARGDINMEEADILMLEPEEQLFHGFRMNNQRRVRTGEIHYFDHPIFGVILKVTPREIEVARPGTN